jgi:hypothetical protein
MDKIAIVLIAGIVFCSSLLSGCNEVKQISELDKFVGLWGETSYNPINGTDEVVGDVTFYENETGISSSSDVFPELFSFSISNNKITVVDSSLEDYSFTYDYYFSDNDQTLNIRNSLGDTTTVYKKM